MHQLFRAITCLSLVLFLGSGFMDRAHAAVNRPAVSISNPTAKTRATNDLLTVIGRASGGAGVTNVLYALGNSLTPGLSWLSADTTNNWTNWTAQVTLAPGTNTLYAYAVDASGTNSATISVRFINVVLAPVTILTNGNVTVSPDYNGKMLQIGTAYTVSGKSAARGFGALTWTDASNNVIQAGNTLRFTMASNLVITANYGDIQAPGIKLLSSYTNGDGIPNKLFIRGSASDNVGLAGVYFQVNGGIWQLAQVTTNQWTNWVAELDDLIPGLNQINFYSMDTSSNRSYTYPLPVAYSTAPARLSGLVGNVLPNSGSAFTMSFGGNTFSQFSSHTNQLTGVGSYSYSANLNEAVIKLKYSSPPVAADVGARTIALSFSSRSSASYLFTEKFATNVPVLVTNNDVVSTNYLSTNVVVSSSGSISFSSAPQMAFSSPASQVLIAIDDAGMGNGTVFGKGSYSNFPLLSTGTNGGKYTYSAYGPLAGLLKFSHTNGTEYVVANFEGTNYGAYYFEDYNLTNGITGLGNGRFIVSSQVAGGNAPASIENKAFTVYSGGESFNDVFGVNTYSQDATTTNYDTAVGDYDYFPADTNVGMLHLVTTAPPYLAEQTNAARLLYVSPNAGIFTNEDGTLSSFVMNSTTNFALTSLDNQVFSIYFSGSFFSSTLSFTNGNEFKLVVPSFFSTSVSTGYCNYYSVASPQGSLARLDFINDSTNTITDWIQFKFNSPTNGSLFISGINLSNTLEFTQKGTFQLK